MKMVYICSPLRGDPEGNIKKAIEYCSYASEQGVIPLAPHTIFTQFLNDDIAQQRQKGLSLGLELLKRCDELWVCGGVISEGMNAEIETAKQLNISTRHISDSQITQNQRPPDMAEQIKEITKYGQILFARNEDGIVTTVVLPEEAKDHFKPEELQDAEDYIIRSSNKQKEPEPVQEEIHDFDMCR